MMKRIIALGLSLIMAISMLTGCGSSALEGTDLVPKITYEDKATTSMNPEFGADGFALVSSNDRFELYIKEKGAGLKVVDKQTGKEWNSTASSFVMSNDFENANPVDPDAYAPEDVPVYTVNNKWQKKMSSMFEIFYTNLSTGYGAVINLSLEELDYSVSYAGIENGIRVTYDIENASIALAIDFSLSDRGLVVDIPQNCIEEKGDYAITSLKLLPYFADALDSNDGYFLYPDGSGAIMEFKDTSHYLESELALSIYGEILNYKNTLFVLDEDDPEVMLPVFGANINNNGFIAVFTKGAELGKVKVTPTNAVIPANAISGEFTFRRTFSDARISDSGVKMYDEKIIQSNRTIEYMFLDEGKTTYSDMAVAYREYLMNECGIAAKAETDNIPLSLDLFMGIKEEGMFVSSFKTVTTFEQSEIILEEFKAAGIDDIQLQLKGWTKNGYFTDPEMFPVNKSIGGKKGLNNLIEYAHENNISVSLEANFVEAAEEASGYSQRDDVMYLGNKTIFAKGGLYILSPRKSLVNLNNFLEDAEDFDIDGVSFYSLGQYVPYNYNSDDYVTQEQTVAIWTNMLETAKSDDDNFVSVQGGNSYVIGKADKITDLTYTDSGYQLTTKSVPFYQVAVHGLTDYTGKAANLCSDLTKEKLKWIEFGYIPYFELTYSGSEDLMYTDYSLLFSSEYQNWIGDAESIYKEMNANLKDVWNSFIVSHEEVKTDVFKVTYDNGKIVYVNYTDKDVVVDRTTIEALNYVVK